MPARAQLRTPLRSAVAAVSRTMSIYSDAFIVAGRTFPGAHIVESPVSDELCRFAQEAAQLQAERCMQGHLEWDRRKYEIEAVVGGNVEEIAAESWPEQSDAAPQELAYEAFHCWRQSPGHWAVASVPHRLFGFGMAQGRNNIWYFTALAGD